MNPARWITSAGILLVFWLLGALLTASGLQERLELAARSALAGQTALAPRLARLRVTFEGQQARLAGSVRSEQDREAAVAVVRDQVRAPTPFFGSLGLRLNPVASVRDDIQIAPLPPGWLMLATTGPEARLLGSAATDFEARDLARSIQDAWGSLGGRVEGLPTVDSERHDEAPAVATSLRSLPPPQPVPALHVAPIGSVWRALPLEESDTTLHDQALMLGVTETEWQEQVAPALRRVRSAREQQRRATEEARRLAALPPGHVFVAVRDGEITLRGEVGTEGVKQSLLDEALILFASHRLHDEIRVSARRRPGDDFAPLTTALLPPGKSKAGKTLFLGFDHEAWKPVDWQVAHDAAPWKDQLPSGTDAVLLQGDSAAVIDWLQGAAKPAPPVHTRPAFLTLALFDGKAVLCGQVAEEATREQVIAAVRRAYAPRFQVQHDHLLVEADCRPFRSLLNTLKSLPPPSLDPTSAILAIAAPAESWRVLPVTADLVEAGGLGRSGGLSSPLSPALVENRSQEALEQLRDWRSSLHPQPGLR